MARTVRLGFRPSWLRVLELAAAVKGVHSHLKPQARTSHCARASSHLISQSARRQNSATYSADLSRRLAQYASLNAPYDLRLRRDRLSAHHKARLHRERARNATALAVGETHAGAELVNRDLHTIYHCLCTSRAGGLSNSRVFS